MLELIKTIPMDKSAKTPLYLQLHERLREMILSGSLLTDYQLPSIRKLSEVLGVNTVTIVSAIKQLEKEGYVYSRLGSGTYVAALQGAGNRFSGSSTIQDELYHQEDLELISSGQIKIHEGTINFASATPTPDLFPVEDFKQALNEVLDRDMGNAFGYQDSQGYFPLRESICGLLGKSMVPCSPEYVQVISGSQQGIDIISKAFLREGDYVIAESPTYTGAIAVFKSRGAEIADVEILEGGPSLNILEYQLKKYKPRLIYTIPSYQNPTGYSYTAQKREGMLKLAEKYDTLIIEDDYISDLAFDGCGIPPLKALDKSDRVILIKSFSKILMPGLRLGFMVVPPRLKSHILEAKHTSDISTSGLLQRAFDQYISKGMWDRHFSRMFQIYRERYETICTALDRHLPESVSYTKPGGGLSLWLNLPYGFPAGSLFKQCAANNVVFAPGRIFYSGSAAQKLNNIRLSFAAVPAEQIEPGIRMLCEQLKSIGQGPKQHNNLPIL
jgi:2-aminoadipate transaminase